MFSKQAKKQYLRKRGAGRPAMPARQACEAIVYVLRTGVQWKALPKERFGSTSAVHKRFLDWEAVGFFEALWKAGLAEYEQMAGIAWRWQSVDGTMMKAPLAQEAVGPNPTDRKKKSKRHLLRHACVPSRSMATSRTWWIGATRRIPSVVTPARKPDAE